LALNLIVLSFKERLLYFIKYSPDLQNQTKDDSN